MTIARNEKRVQTAGLDDQGQIRFTPEFRGLIAELGWDGG